MSNEAASGEVKELTEQLIASFNGKKLDSYLGAMADDVQAYAGVGSPLRFDDKQEWKGFIDGLASMASATYLARQPTYRAYNDDTVVVNGYFDFTVVDNNGIATTTSGRSSMVWVKAGGDWKVVNMHFSNLFESF